jgi:hypothetical protein
VNTIAADPLWHGRLFAGSDLGVHLSDDGGATWSILRGGFPYVVVLDLVLHEGTRTLYAATHGRSLYTYDLNQLPPADGDGDGADNNHDCAIADPGTFSLPPEVEGVQVDDVAGVAVLSWSSLAGLSGPSTLYDVAFGDLGSLLVSGTAGSSTLECGLSDTTVSDPGILPPGSGSYYLVRGRNSCGAGGWGKNSQSIERSSPACP